MENPKTWRPIHHLIQEVLDNNQASEMLPYELIAVLQEKNFLSPEIDSGEVVESIENVVWKFQDSLEKQECGASLPLRLGKLIESL